MSVFTKMWNYKNELKISTLAKNVKTPDIYSQKWYTNFENYT